VSVRKTMRKTWPASCSGAGGSERAGVGASGVNDLFGLHASDEVAHVTLPNGARILYNHRILSTSIIAIIEVHCNNPDHGKC